MPNGITPIIPEIYYEVRTIYGRDWLPLNINPYSYEILSTSVRCPFWYVTFWRSEFLHVLNLNHVTYLALVLWFNLFYPVY